MNKITGTQYHMAYLSDFSPVPKQAMSENNKSGV